MYKGKFASELSMCEAKEYYDVLRMRCPRTDEQWADFNILKEKLIAFAYEILDGKTNGDVIKALFPHLEWMGACKDVDFYLLDSDAAYSAKLNTFKSWWNAPHRAEGASE